MPYRNEKINIFFKNNILDIVIGIPHPPGRLWLFMQKPCLSATALV